MTQLTDLLKQTGGKTFCQIVGRDITAPICLETQGHEGCFGCAAPTRLCELCRKRTVDVPAVGMCSSCLIGQLQKEASSSKPTVGALVRVDCQLLKRQISGQMCRATQGQEGCRNCPAPTRFCENCKQRSVRYKQYGLCLACSVEEYGGGWKPESAETSVPEPEPAIDARPPRRLEDLVVFAVLDRGHFPTEELDVEEAPEVNPSSVEPASPKTANGTSGGSAMVRTQTMHLSGKDYRVTVRVAPPRGGDEPMTPSQPVELNPPQLEFEKLVQSGKKVVVARRRGSIGLLHRELNINWSVARQVIDRLEKDGVVGPDRPKTFRKVLILPHREKAAKKPGSKKPGRIGGKAERLVEKAKELVLEHRNATYEFLQLKLGTGSLTTKRILQILEGQGVVSPGTKGRPRRVLLESGSSPATALPRARRPKMTTEARVARLEELAKFFGPRSDTSRTLREVIRDLEELQRVKQTLRRLGQE